VDLPNETDVLTGQGKPMQLHPGNIQFRILVESYLEQFKQKKLQRQLAIDAVYSLIKSRPGRFLYRDDDGWWRESSEADAKEKITSAFLTAMTKQRRSSLAVTATAIAAMKKIKGTSTDETSRTSTTMTIGTMSLREWGGGGDRTSMFLPQEKRARYNDSGCCCRSDVA